MLKIAVCDDNIQFAQILVEKIRTLCATTVSERILCEIVTAFTTADSVVDYLKDNTIDLLFLDIEMPGRHGFSLAKELNKLYPDIVIVFVSAHNKYVFKSFDFSPLCFLRKNKLEEELPSAFKRAIEKCMYSKDTLDFSTTDGDITLRISDIIYIESQKNYFMIHCKHDTFKCRGTISKIEQLVKDYDFCRIHAAYLVNFTNLSRQNNENTILMTNGDILPISQRRYSTFKNDYQKFIRRRNIK